MAEPEKTRGPKLGVRVRPDTAKFAAELRTKLAAIEKAQGPLKIKVEADFKGLENFRPKINIDTAAISKSIDETLKRAATIKFKAAIDEGSFASIGADLKRQIDRVQADLQRLKKQAEEAREAQEKPISSSSTIKVDADTTAAEAQIATAARNRRATISVHANTARATAEIKGMLAGLAGARVASDLVQNLGSRLMELDRAVPQMGGVAIGIGGISGAALAAVGSVVSLGQSLGAVVGVAGTLPAVAGSLAAIGGTLLTAFNGVGTALGAVKDAASPEAAATATSNAAAVKAAYAGIARAQESAAEGAKRATKTLRNAREALAETQKSTAKSSKAASDSVVQAQKAETAAHRDVATAQRDLTQARRDASRQLKELDSQLRGAVLDGRELEQQLVDAQQAYQEALTDPTRGQGALDALKLQADRAAQAVKDNQRKVSELSADKSKADRQGVQGSDRVLKAEETLTAARERQAEAIKSAQAAQAHVAETELANATALRNAREALAEAQDGQAAQAREAARASAAAAAALATAQATAAAHTSAAATALAELTPNAREAVTAIDQVRTRLGGVRDAAQEAFFEGFAQPLTALADVVIPQLEVGMAGLAGAMGDGWKITMDSLRQELGGGVLENLFAKTTEGAVEFNGALAPAVSSLVTLGTVGVDYLPRMGAAIADAMTTFDAFIEKTAADGSLDQWIENGITAMKDLGSVIGSTFSIFGSIGEASLAAGGTTLSTFADGLERVAELMQQEPFQSTMTAIFRGANDAMGGIGVALGHVGDLLVVLAPTIETVLGKAGEAIAVIAEGVGAALSDPAFGAGLTAFFDGLLLGLDALLPVMPQVGELLGAVFTVAGELAAVLGPVLGAALAALIPPVLAVLEAVMPLIQALGPLLVNAINFVAPILALLGSNLGSIVGVVTSLATGIHELLKGNIEGFFAGILQAALGLIDGLLGQMTGVLEIFKGWDLFGSGEALIGGFIDGLLAGFRAMREVVQNGMDWLAGFFPNSPAKHGPFSGAGWTKLQRSGGAIGDEFAKGLGDTSAVDRAAEDLMRSAGLTGSVTVKGSATAPAAAVGTTNHITVNEASDAHQVATEVSRLVGPGV